MEIEHHKIQINTLKVKRQYVIDSNTGENKRKEKEMSEMDIKVMI